MTDKPETRRFPPPWIAEETDTCFIVRDADGQAARVDGSGDPPAGNLPLSEPT